MSDETKQAEVQQQTPTPKGPSLTLECTDVETMHSLQTVTLKGEIEGLPVQFQVQLHDADTHGAFKKHFRYEGSLTEVSTPAGSELQAKDEAAKSANLERAKQAQAKLDAQFAVKSNPAAAPGKERHQFL